MKAKEYKVLGHKVAYNVTESSDEFNKLDPSRKDASNDEAVANIVYRSMNPETRFTFLHGRDAIEAKDGQPGLAGIIGVEQEVSSWELPVPTGATYADGTPVDTWERRTKEVLDKKTGKPRVKDGEPVVIYNEAEEVYYNRVAAMSVAAKKFAAEDAFREHFQPLIEKIALEIKFDPTAPERAERGPRKLAFKYKAVAAKQIMNKTLDAVNANQLAKINKVFALRTPAEGEAPDRFTGSYEEKAVDGTVTTINFDVDNKDAEALGWLIKEYLDWKANQVMASEF
jgi:hypothetical protein